MTRYPNCFSPTSSSPAISMRQVPCTCLFTYMHRPAPSHRHVLLCFLFSSGFCCCNPPQAACQSCKSCYSSGDSRERCGYAVWQRCGSPRSWTLARLSWGHGRGMRGIAQGESASRGWLGRSGVSHARERHHVFATQGRITGCFWRSRRG